MKPAIKNLLNFSLVFALFAVNAARAATAEDSAFAKSARIAEESFDKGDFSGAVNHYEELIKSGIINGHLYYNLGIAYYRLGRTGDAVAAFLAARRYLPRDPDTEANLKLVLAHVHDKLEPEIPATPSKSAFFWLGRFTQRELAIAAALLVAFWGLGVTLIFLVPRLQKIPSLRWAAGASAILPLLAVLSFFMKTKVPETWAAVNHSQTKVYSGPGTFNPVLFELQDGAPVLVTQVASGFLRVQLSDGKNGWISDSNVRVLDPLI